MPSNPNLFNLSQAVVLHDFVFSSLGVGPAKNIDFLFFIIVLLLEKNFTISNNKSFNKWIVLYNLGLLYLIITLSIRGILQVIGSDFVGLSHIAGLGHAILGVSLVWFLAIVNKELKVYDSNILSKNK